LYPLVIGFEFVAAGTDQFQKAIQLGEVLVPNDGGLRHDAGGAFQVDKTDRAIEFKFHFDWVEQVKDREIVFFKAEVLESAEDFLRFMEEVGHDNDQGARANFSARS